MYGMHRQQRLTWSDVGVNFSGSNQARAQGMQGISQAGDVFGKLEARLADEQRRRDDVAYRAARFGFDKEKHGESVRQFGKKHDLAVRGQEHTEQAHQDMMGYRGERLGLDQSKFAHQRDVMDPHKREMDRGQLQVARKNAATTAFSAQTGRMSENRIRQTSIEDRVGSQLIGDILAARENLPLQASLLTDTDSRLQAMVKSGELSQDGADRISRNVRQGLDTLAVEGSDEQVALAAGANPENYLNRESKLEAAAMRASAQAVARTNAEQAKFDAEAKRHFNGPPELWSGNSTKDLRSLEQDTYQRVYEHVKKPRGPLNFFGVGGDRINNIRNADREIQRLTGRNSIVHEHFLSTLRNADPRETTWLREALTMKKAEPQNSHAVATTFLELFYPDIFAQLSPEQLRSTAGKAAQQERQRRGMAEIRYALPR